VDLGVHVQLSTPLLLEVAPEIDTNPTSFYRWRGRGVAPPSDPRYRLALAMSVHPIYFDLATPLCVHLLIGAHYKLLISHDGGREIFTAVYCISRYKPADFVFEFVSNNY